MIAAKPQMLSLRDGELVLYQRSRSHLYQCRYKLANGEWHRQTTGKASVEHAIAQILSTILYARKLDSDWTLLLKNYYLYQHNRDDAAGRAIGNARQERFITGFAWRPTSHNQFNALARYEYKAVDDGSQSLGERYDANIFSVNMEYKPSRQWWANTRLAWKSSSDYTVVSPDQTFNAALWSGRLTFDVTDKWDLGALVSTLQQADGKAGQDARGLEAGYQVHKNAWISVGYNWMGYFDRDLSGTDYTQQGPYLRLRAKFDELSF